MTVSYDDLLKAYDECIVGGVPDCVAAVVTFDTAKSLGWDESHGLVPGYPVLLTRDNNGVAHARSLMSEEEMP